MALINRWMSWLLIAVLTVVWTAPVGVGAAAAQAVGVEAGRRVALVIGNTAYESAEPLKNAVNDSRAVTESLQNLGFEVFGAENIGLQEFSATIEAFEREARGASAAVFFYSGHGFQLGGANYLVPTDAKLSSRDAIEKETLRLDAIISRLQARDRQTLIFLDACRNNPLPEGVRGKGDGDGLAQIETGTGTFVAFATQPGNISHDGDGDNSPFTLALLDHIQTPGISISDMMIRVRNTVEDQTQQTQTPWDQSSLRSQFYFNPEAEADEALTEEDRDLLLSLDPELRKKFEARFGIKISEPTEEGEAPEELVATIQPRFVISGGSTEEEPAPALESDDVAASADTPDAPLVGRLVIEEAQDEPAVAVLSRDEPLLNADGAIPTPFARPDEGAQQQVAALASEDDAPAAVNPPAAAPQAATEAPVPVVETPAVSAESPPSADVAAIEPAEELVVIEAEEEPAFLGPFVPAPVTTTAETAKRSDDGEEVRVAAISESDALKGAVDGKPIGPVTRGIDRIAGEEVTFAPGIGAAVPSATLAPVATAIPVDRPVIAPAAPVAQPSVAAASPVDTAAPVQSATALADSTPSGVVVLGSEPAQTPAASENVTQPVVAAVAPTTVAPPAVPGAPVLIPTPQLTLPVGEPVTAEPEVRTAAVAPEQIRPAAIERAEPPEEAPKPEPQAVPLPTEEEEREMASLIQSELTRLGCYRSGIDGIWGSNSARGLLRYFATKKEDPDDLEPNAQLLTRLLSEPEVVCKRTEVAPAVAASKPRAPKASVSRSKPAAVSRERPAKATASTKSSKPKATASGNAPKRKLSKNLKLGGLR